MDFFIRLCLRGRDLQDPENRQRCGTLSGGIGIALNLLLFLGKLLAGMITASIAVTADAFNNLSDAASSVVTLVGFRLAGREADEEHPFGHGRMEYLAGLAVSMLILLVGLELAKSSVGKMLHPEPVDFNLLPAGILAVSIGVKLWMFFFNRELSRRIHSAALAATAADSLSDTVATSAVLAATLIGHYANIAIDGWCGMLVGLFICYAGYTAARDTISPLLGQAPDPEFVNQINDIVMSHEEILGIHDLIVHNYGPGRILISLHAEVPADGNFLALHDKIDIIEHELRDILNCHAVIHMDPVCVGDEETVRLKALVKEYLKEISGTLTMHDFRIVAGPTHTNLIFDVVTPYGFSLSDAELVALIQESIQKDNPNYFAVIEVDKQMV